MINNRRLQKQEADILRVSEICPGNGAVEGKTRHRRMPLRIVESDRMSYLFHVQ
jgi:hypothetical protein